ncbi:WD40 repeat domain-containing protein [Parafrankia sp. CH37]|nr:WD40 repeat domain-containing protein [Parafrankia sp. CH37]MBE3206576.1 hypothetical protein [Parafrankia sp. CH37]
MLTNEGLVTDLEFSSDGKLLVAESTFDNTVRLWTSATHTRMSVGRS